MDLLNPQDAQILSVLLSSLPDASVLAAPSVDLSLAVRLAVKVFHDHAMKAAKLEQPRTLLVDGFDAEQVWVQINKTAPQLQRSTRKLLKGVGVAAALMDEATERDIDELLGEPSAEPLVSPVIADEEQEAVDADGAQTRRPEINQHPDELAEGDTDDGESLDQDLPEDAIQDQPRARLKPRLPTEDDFMNLEEMEAFVNQAEAEEAEDEDESAEDESDDAEAEAEADGLSEDEQEDWSGLDDNADVDADEDDAILEPGTPEPEEGAAGEDTLAVGKYGLDGALSQGTSTPAEQGGTSHERRMARMNERVKALEAANMGDKAWYLRGEANSGARPLNSALEVDLDFERAVAPPPQPTREAMESLESLIKARIADHRFDDPPRMAAAEPEPKQRPQIELDDSKSKKGLGDLYEADYLHKVAGAVPEDKQQAVRDRLRADLRMLFNKLDALSHFHYAPKPVAPEMGVSAPPVPALALETVGPQLASTAGQRMPEEMLAAQRKDDVRTPDELNKQERKRRRAHKKAVAKKANVVKANNKVTGNIIGRKSDSQEDATTRQKKRKASDAAAPQARTKYTKSSVVFGMLQDEREKGPQRPSGHSKSEKPSAAFKL